MKLPLTPSLHTVISIRAGTHVMQGLSHVAPAAAKPPGQQLTAQLSVHRIHIPISGRTTNEILIHLFFTHPSVFINLCDR